MILVDQIFIIFYFILNFEAFMLAYLFLPREKEFLVQAEGLKFYTTGVKQIIDYNPPEQIEKNTSMFHKFIYALIRFRNACNKVYAFVAYVVVALHLFFMEL